MRISRLPVHRPFPLALGLVLVLSACSGPDDPTPAPDAPAAMNAVASSASDDAWSGLRCELMAGMLSRIDARLRSSIAVLYEGELDTGAAEDELGRLLDLFERLGEEADVLLSVRPGVAPEYCFRGGDNALLATGHRLLVSHLVERVDCRTLMSESPALGRQAERLLALEARPSATLYWGGVPETDRLDGQLTAKRFACMEDI